MIVGWIKARHKKVFSQEAYNLELCSQERCAGKDTDRKIEIMTLPARRAKDGP